MNEDFQGMQTESIPKFKFPSNIRNRPVDIMSLGSLVMEEVIQVDRWPDAGGQGVVLIKSITSTSGGCAMSVSCFGAWQGASTSIISAIGDGKYSSLPMKELVNSGVNTDYLNIYEGKDGNLIIILSDLSGDWSVLEYINPEIVLKVSDIPPLDAFFRTKILHIDGFSYVNLGSRDPVIKALDHAKQAKCLISVDASVPAANTANDFLNYLFRQADIVFANLFEAFSIIGTSDISVVLQTLQKMNPKISVIKMGEKGSFVVTPNAVGYVPAFEVHVADTVAAGDAYIATMLYSLASGNSLMASAKRGSAAGALACLGYGSLSYHFTNEDLDLLINLG